MTNEKNDKRAVNVTGNSSSITKRDIAKKGRTLWTMVLQVDKKKLPDIQKDKKYQLNYQKLQ